MGVYLGIIVIGLVGYMMSTYVLKLHYDSELKLFEMQNSKVYYLVHTVNVAFWVIFIQWGIIFYKFLIDKGGYG